MGPASYWASSRRLSTRSCWQAYAAPPCSWDSCTDKVADAGPAGDVIVEFLRSPLSFLERVAQGYGGLVGLKLGGEHVVLVTNKGLARQVLVDQADNFVKAGSALALSCTACPGAPAHSFC